MGEKSLVPSWTTVFDSTPKEDDTCNNNECQEVSRGTKYNFESKFTLKVINFDIY